tara:strand:+ start:7623 stop:7736 length:114 start_codon:yes stop_codon:yes gene_type:complete
MQFKVISGLLVFKSLSNQGTHITSRYYGKKKERDAPF